MHEAKTSINSRCGGVTYHVTAYEQPGGTAFHIGQSMIAEVRPLPVKLHYYVRCYGIMVINSAENISKTIS